MCSKYIILVLACFLVFYVANAQILTCTYRTDSSYGYTCDVFIYNPSGTYNFSRISGTHLTGKTNEDVRYILRTTDSNTTNIPSIICETFQNAIRFNLSSIRISRIDENSFWGCKSLKYLDLSYNLLKTLPVNAFSTHPPSNTNKIYELPWDKYGSHLQNLEYLYLQNNQIEEILPNTFSSLTSLITLRLDYNRIEEILPWTFNSLVNLKTLWLINNKIIKLNANSFESMEKLTDLHLEYNQIEEIPPGTFNSLVNLLTLRLFNNNITKMVPESFESLGNVTTVYLSNNQIQELTPKVFSSLINLEVLDLSYNNISSVFSDSFDSLGNLIRLYLNRNQIEELPRNAFSSLKQLPTIDLYNNKLKVIHSFGILPKLTTVFLENNQIDAFDQDLIDDTGVKTLDMSNNLCASFSITDSSTLRLQMRMKLLDCFANYGNLLPETTTVSTTTLITTESSEITTSITTELSTTDFTSSTPGCIGGNIDERVCRLEDKNEDFNEQILELQTTLENKSKAFAAALEELENKIEELSNRPCACG